MDKFEEHILKWYNKDIYHRIGNDVSVTELMKPVRMVHLTNRHRPKLTASGLSDLIPSLTGNGIHDQLQRYLKIEGKLNNNWSVERRVLIVKDGVRISGRYDALYNWEDLYDIKSTRCWKIEKGDYSEWEEQLNIYDWMLWKDGIELNSLKIIAILLDWQLGQSWKKGYPNSRVAVIPITRWSRTQQEKYMASKVTEWKVNLSVSDNKLPFCSPESRWAGKPVFKLYRTSGQQKASKTFPSRSRASSYLAACQLKDAQKWAKGFIKKEFGNPWNRCDKWCDAAPFCNQYQLKLEK